MQAGSREKTSCALPGVLTQPTGQVSACTTLWTLGNRLLCYTTGFAPTKYNQFRHQHHASSAKGKLGDDFY